MDIRVFQFLSSPLFSNFLLHFHPHRPSCSTAVRPHTLATCGDAVEVLFAQIKVCNESAFALSAPMCQSVTVYFDRIERITFVVHVCVLGFIFEVVLWFGSDTRSCICIGILVFKLNVVFL